MEERGPIPAQRDGLTGGFGVYDSPNLALTGVAARGAAFLVVCVPLALIILISVL